MVLESEKKEGWDTNNAHNPYVIIAEGKIKMYYIANDLGTHKPNHKLNSPANVSLWFENNRKSDRNITKLGDLDPHAQVASDFIVSGVEPKEVQRLVKAAKGKNMTVLKDNNDQSGYYKNISQSVI